MEQGWFGILTIFTTHGDSLTLRPNGKRERAKKIKIKDEMRAQMVNKMAKLVVHRQIETVEIDIGTKM